MNQTAELKVIPEATDLVDLGTNKKKISALNRKYKEVPDFETKEGYAEGKKILKLVSGIRIAIDKERKIQVQSAVDHQRRINGEARELTDLLSPIEARFREPKTLVDETKKREKREAEEAESNRIEDIKSLIQEIQDLTDGLLGASSELLEERLESAKGIEIDDTYAEFSTEAEGVINRVINDLSRAVASQHVLDEQNEVIAKQQEAMAEQQRVMDEQQAAIDNKQREQDERDAEIKKQTEAVEKAEKDRIAAAEKAEQEKIHAKKFAKEREARLPQDTLVRGWVDAMIAVPVPEVEDDNLQTVVRDALVALSDLNSMVYRHTNAPDIDND